MRFWTWKLAASLVLVALFLFDAFWLGPDPITGQARHVLPYADTGVASFVFLLALLYVISHAGQYGLRRWRGRNEEPQKAPDKRRRKKRR